MRRFLVRASLPLLLAASASGAASAALAAGAVSSGDATANDVGLALLAAGGNAADAAVGTALALAVVYPEAGNLGGGGFALVRRGEEIAALDFRESAPAAATAAMYLDGRGEPIPNASLVGPLAAGVPGSPAGLWELHRRFGRLPWARVVAPALELARRPLEVSARMASTLADERDRLARFPESTAVWFRDGRPVTWGERVDLSPLATTLERYAREGPSAITTGAAAASIEEASRRHGGILTSGDLAAYRPAWRAPLRFEAFGWSFAAMPLPSSGGFLLAESLALLERLGWSSLPPDSIDRAHRLAEAFRLAYADRFGLGDPGAGSSSLERLLAPQRLDRLAAGVDKLRAGVSLPPSGEHEAGSEGSDTTHLSVLDGDGMAVALTTTLNELYGCGLWLPGAGFFLNDEMDDFTTALGRANEFGLLQGRANAIAPGRRPLSSMAPTIAWRDRALVALGGRGGSRIPSAVLQVFLALLDGDAPRAAVARPRLHHQWLPDRLEFEPGALSEEARGELARRGHTLAKATQLPKVNLVLRDGNGTLFAAGDPRAGEAGRTIPASGARR